MKTMCAVVIILSILAGCNKSSQNGAAPAPSHDKYYVKTEQTIPGRPVINDSKSVSAHLESLARSVPNVKGANCVVIGNTAIVGLDIDGKLDRSRVGTIKYAVAEALRKDPYGKYAIVTADMDIAQRIREIRQDIGNGHPVQGFANELTDIIGRIMPQLPRDVNTPDNGPDSGQNQLHRKSL
ncbi:YhcN/YlaJ family sporulation lipoprotein [Paenibacillus gansuensis]|uniref:YhcN/YlaJ family sporulation lipoprotein n=1 Tax=Paenibacillus gansuensis TaxID=306542 RepID=A0ABW5PC22_9BACL